MGNAVSYCDYYNTSSACLHTQREYLAHYARRRYYWLQRQWHSQRDWAFFHRAHQQHTAQSLYDLSPAAASLPQRRLQYPVLAPSPFGFQGYASVNARRLTDLSCPPGYYLACYSLW